MQIVGFNLKKISIERFSNITGKVEIKSNIDISEIKKEEIDLSKEKQVLSFNFNFDIDYQPKIASIQFKGNVLVLASHEEEKEVFKKWKKKEMPETTRLAVFNMILMKCNVKALELEDNIGLPSHLPLPRLSKEQPGQEYTG